MEFFKIYVDGFSNSFFRFYEVERNYDDSKAITLNVKLNEQFEMR